MQQKKKDLFKSISINILQRTTLFVDDDDDEKRVRVM